jgi:hypothetical protein
MSKVLKAATLDGTNKHEEKSEQKTIILGPWMRIKEKTNMTKLLLLLSCIVRRASCISSLVGASPHDATAPTRARATMITPLFSYQFINHV